MNNDFDFTIVVSSFNRDDKIRETLSRIFDSDLNGFNKIDLIIIDDGSPRPVSDLLDGSLPIPDKFQFRLIEQENAGIGATRNRGFRAARSNLVLFLDDDILINPDTLNLLVAANLEQNHGVVFGSYPFISHESESLKQFAQKLYGYDRMSNRTVYEKVDAITSGLLSVDKAKVGHLDYLYQDNLSVPAAEEHEIIYRFHELGIPIFHALHISAIHNHHLELSWLVTQQFKYGLATAEAFQKYPDILKMSKFAELRHALESIGKISPKNLFKFLLVHSFSRRALLAYVQLVQRLWPNRTRDTTFGLLTSSYFWAGYREGKRRFKCSRN